MGLWWGRGGAQTGFRRAAAKPHLILLLPLVGFEGYTDVTK